ncbi:phosphate ABC transporter substrate-binding protein [Scytonema hofmannii PCC 7110]|uniref:Phosphate ABC transporter substrate-binding protein n=1 Tax=Scytonema hofmannii PCC 7110 TaxID=128403 RepID=A0A139WS39_9CYAN|nr:substrate-binding domain-containing protein [Scytonema hofmannii]KYC35254.1 phosphate ABC transporter substrate-binding protein [Scytonema hofmannii PCC 7110]
MGIVKIKIRRTSEEGFLVILTATNREYETEGFLLTLPPELETSFTQWQSAYRQIEDVRSCIAPAPGLRLTPISVTVHSNLEHTQALKTNLNEWLNSGDSKWQPIRDGLIAIAQQLHSSGEEIRVILDAKDINLRRLPWQEWSLFEQHYPQAEIALSAPKTTDHKSVARPNSSKVRILVAVGRSDGINTTDDIEVVRRLEELGAEVVCLMQPNLKNLCEALWDEQGYHIFIFTGHSGSRKDGQIGWIEVNDSESLSIEEFKEALKEAIAKGLQLAIFNSCDGLGLANQLAELHLPQSVVMREPVPDPVAVEFLKHFFQEFTRNKSLFASVLKARKRLEHFKSRYPGAVWLPTICIASNVEPLTWLSLSGNYPKATVSKLSTAKFDRSHLPILKSQKAALLAGMMGLCLGCAIAIPATIVLNQRSESAQQPKQSSIKSITVLSGTWLYGGSTTWAPIRGLVDQKIKQELPEFNLTYTQHPTLPPGSGTGIKMLLDGQISFAQSSRPILDKEYELAAARGVKLKQVPVAIDAIAIAVHPILKIEGLTVEQLKGIYTGRITNWSQIGGPNVKITPLSRPLNSGTSEFFKENILENQVFGSNIVFIPTTTQALNKVGNFPEEGAIYYASASEIIKQCTVKTLPVSRHKGSALISPEIESSEPGGKCQRQYNKLNLEVLQNGEYPLTRRLFVIIKQNGQVDEQAGEAYASLLLTREGQKLTEKAEFIPMR